MKKTFNSQILERTLDGVDSTVRETIFEQVMEVKESRFRDFSNQRDLQRQERKNNRGH
jgi:hypothetical protein